MTFHQPYPTDPKPSAADRVRTFLSERAPMRGLDPQHITACNEAVITVSDLQILIAQADHLRLVDETAHRVIENGACYPRR